MISDIKARMRYGDKKNNLSFQEYLENSTKKILNL